MYWLYSCSCLPFYRTICKFISGSILKFINSLMCSFIDTVDSTGCASSWSPKNNTRKTRTATSNSCLLVYSNHSHNWLKWMYVSWSIRDSVKWEIFDLCSSCRIIVYDKWQLFSGEMVHSQPLLIRI